jgi:uncharacterized cupin superfamily protein
MSADDVCLVRAAARTGVRDLSGPTGMARLVIREARLAPDEELALGAGEWFVYVCAGHGTLAGPDASRQLAPGDFLGIPGAAGCRLRNTGVEDLVCLCGGEKT